MALIGYARVSTQEQDLEAQVAALECHGCEKIFSGKQSGNSLDNEKKLLTDYTFNGSNSKKLTF